MHRLPRTSSLIVRAALGVACTMASIETAASATAQDGVTIPSASASATQQKVSDEQMRLDLRLLIEAQRARLDAQAETIDALGREIEALRARVEELRTAALETRRELAGLKAQPPPPAIAAVEARLQEVEHEVQRLPEMPTEIVSSGDFPGSIRIPGTDAAFKIGGQARQTLVHTLQALGTDDRFVTSSIPVGDAQRAGEDARIVYSAQPSRANLDLRTATPIGPFRTFLEADFAGSGDTVRMRHAFVQGKGWMVGQSWSTFSDPEADPIGIDFEGLNAISLFRQPQVRYTVALREQLRLAFALENPAPDLTDAQGVSLTPDFIARLRWEPKKALNWPLLGRTAHVQGAILVRQLRGELDDRPDVTLATGGFGANVSGAIVPRWDPDDRVKFAINAGWGIGRYITDLRTLGGQDAVYDPALNDLRALQVSSGYFGYERLWRRTFTSTFTYGIVHVQNLDIQPDTALQRTQRTSLNLTWAIIPQAELVLEFLAGTRVNKDGQHGTSSQIQTGWTFRF